MVDQLAAAARAQALAHARRNRNRVMVVVRDPTQRRFLVYSLDLTDLFSPRPRPRPQSHGGKLLTFADPLAILRYADIGVGMEVAASASGHVIAAAATSGQTFIVDAATRSLSPVPGTRHVKRNFFHVPVGDNAFFLMRKFFLPGAPEGRTCELLFSPPNSSSSSWGCCALPDPPGLHPRWEVNAYFVAGAHVWVSLCSQGTFSFDTVSRRWHTQGTWELPFNGAAIFVPDFRGSGRNLLFGFVGTVLRLSACDMDAMPPAIIASWPETCPSRARYAFSAQTVQLTYFGDGRFCIALNAAIQTEEEEDRPPPRRSIVSLLAVEITRDMKLIKRHFRRYSLPPRSHTTHVI